VIHIIWNWQTSQPVEPESFGFMLWPLHTRTHCPSVKPRQGIFLVTLCCTVTPVIVVGHLSLL
jgi:hypothetical protein